ncbi:hypothetical protein A9975_16495 [Cupriavidus sp. UME77]|nr:hypothetical protein [Cupriavidus sp. UME77]
MDEWTQRLIATADEDPAPAVTKALSRMERAMDRVDASCPPTQGESAALFQIWTAGRRLYASRVKGWVQFEQNISRKLAVLAQLAKRNADIAQAPISLAVSGFRFSAAFCEQQSMCADKPISVLDKLTKGYDEYDVIASVGEQQGLAREWRAVIPILPVLPVKLLSPLSRWSVGLSMLAALDRATSYTELAELELKKKRTLQCNPYFVLGQLLRANVGIVIFHGFGNSHLISRHLPLLWDYMGFLRDTGVGVVLWGTSALDLCAGPSFYKAFPGRPTGLNPYRIDDASARQLAAFYWNRLDVHGQMPAGFASMVQRLAGQREWIEMAIRSFLERVYLGGNSPEDAAQAALDEVIADGMVGALSALIEWHRKEIDKQKMADWRDWLPVRTGGKCA